jgi:hypothetical protein
MKGRYQMVDAVEGSAIDLDESPAVIGRRTALSRGAAALAGLAGVRLMGPTLRSSDGLPSDALRALTKGGNLTLAARNMRATSGGTMPPATGDRLLTFAELLDASGQRKVGEFYAVCICAHAPFGVTIHSAAQVEQHVFVTKEGTIVGFGTVPPNGIGRPAAFAITGGTGRFEGVRGSYEAIQSPVELGGNGKASYKFSILR